jgi:hypothetical protein
VLANIVVGTGLLVDPVETLVASVGHIFLVQRPRDSPVLKQVDDRGDVLRDLGEWVTIKAEVVTTIGQDTVHRES